MNSGKVYLVGAGPGDPKLITLRGIECLQIADVVIYDLLVNQVLLDLYAPLAEKIYGGKMKGQQEKRQAEINQQMIDCTRAGQTVVRLKGGDPFVFGRGGDEALVLAEAGIDFEIVPGITSAIAVPAYAGIPLTMRDYASSFAVVTGHSAA
ncbi:MAG: uroporphyrinogen-III C-methyltransferase, partial [Candidatus Poribacteria bacterium]|nr:uroporphyrinogen-III C-methyltransferase [Candidatus Poribacteria bacterium]